MVYQYNRRIDIKARLTLAEQAENAPIAVRDEYHSVRLLQAHVARGLDMEGLSDTRDNFVAIELDP